MANKIQIRRDTAANWTSANPTLSQGEQGYETDTGKLKIGDGSTAWTSLGYSFEGYTDSDVDTHLNTSTAASGEVLSWTGSDYDWIASGGGSPDLFADNDVSATAPTASGDNSVAIGDDAQATSTNSIAIGSTYNGSGARATTGAGAVAIGGSRATGAEAFAANIGSNSSSGAQGTSSIAMGFGANASATESVSIGKNTTASGSNSLALGQNSAASATNSIAIGDTATSSTANQISLGGTTDTVKISGAYTLPTSDGTANQVLTTDGSGAVTFADAGGGGASELNDLSDAVGNATTDNYGAGRDVLGDITTGQDNTAFGGLAGQQITTGSSNTFYGGNAGRFVTTGSYNVGVGLNAASGTNLDKQTGDYNIGIGYNAGNAVISTDKNTAVGYNADNTGNPTGSTAIGSDAVAAGDQATALTDSYASGADSFAAAITNNTSSYGAQGTNSIAIGRRAKATGQESLSFGPSNTVSVDYCGAYGRGNTISGSSGSSYAFGHENTVSAGTAYAIGHKASAATTKFAFSLSRFSANGDAQQGMFVLRSDTTDATAEALTTNNGTASATNQVVLPTNAAFAFHGTIVAKQSGSANAAAWKVEGLIVNNGGTTTLTNSATTVISNTPSWGMTLSADNTNNALAITVTGAAATNIRWVATIHTSEVTYA